MKGGIATMQSELQGGVFTKRKGGVKTPEIFYISTFFYSRQVAGHLKM
jgi:hypothetical protein